MGKDRPSWRPGSSASRKPRPRSDSTFPEASVELPVVYKPLIDGAASALVHQAVVRHITGETAAGALKSIPQNIPQSVPPAAVATTAADAPPEAPVATPPSYDEVQVTPIRHNPFQIEADRLIECPEIEATLTARFPGINFTFSQQVKSMSVEEIDRLCSFLNGFGGAQEIIARGCKNVEIATTSVSVKEGADSFVYNFIERRESGTHLANEKRFERKFPKDKNDETLGRRFEKTQTVRIRQQSPAQGTAEIRAVLAAEKLPIQDEQPTLEPSTLLRWGEEPVRETPPVAPLDIELRQENSLAVGDASPSDAAPEASAIPPPLPHPKQPHVKTFQEDARQTFGLPPRPSAAGPVELSPHEVNKKRALRRELEKGPIGLDFHIQNPHQKPRDGRAIAGVAAGAITMAAGVVALYGIGKLIPVVKDRLREKIGTLGEAKKPPEPVSSRPISGGNYGLPAVTPPSVLEAVAAPTEESVAIRCWQERDEANYSVGCEDTNGQELLDSEYSIPNLEEAARAIIREGRADIRVLFKGSYEGKITFRKEDLDRGREQAHRATSPIVERAMWKERAKTVTVRRPVGTRD